MTGYVLGAGASFSAGYPLASNLLDGLSAWLDRCDPSVHWVPWARNRIVQVRETFGSLEDFEGILGKLDEYGTSALHRRVRRSIIRITRTLLTTVSNASVGAIAAIPPFLLR